MKRANELTRGQLEQIVDGIQQTLFLDCGDEGMVFNREKEQQSGADFISAVTETFYRVEPRLLPDEETPYDAIEFSKG